jgi:transcriptional regulator with XRE-family HTH domain
MHGPGESLRHEREARGKSIEEMAEATGIRLPLLTALEQEAFDSLPGRGFGKLYIRAYAEVLGFDPRPVIEAYDRAVPMQEAEATTPAAAGAPRPGKAALARWRQELMARRAEAGLSGEPGEETLDELEGMEQEPDPESEPIAVEQETAPEFMEESTVQTVPRPTEPAEELIEEVPPRPLPVEAVSPSPPAPSRQWLVEALLVLILLPFVVYLVFRRSTHDPPPVVARHEPVPAEVIAPPPSLPPPPEAAEAPDTRPRTRTPVRDPTASSLEVAESGVGLRLVGTRLEGEGDRFRPGQRVTFAMRVLGGGAGESIRHVWLRDGKVEQSIRLRLGGPSWRTHSTKTLGRPGIWTVEARDEQGHVLARADLTVAP